MPSSCHPVVPSSHDLVICSSHPIIMSFQHAHKLTNWLTNGQRLDLQVCFADNNVEEIQIMWLQFALSGFRWLCEELLQPDDLHQYPSTRPLGVQCRLQVPQQGLAGPGRQGHPGSGDQVKQIKISTCSSRYKNIWMKVLGAAWCRGQN